MLTNTLLLIRELKEGIQSGIYTPAWVKDNVDIHWSLLTQENVIRPDRVAFLPLSESLLGLEVWLYVEDPSAVSTVSGEVIDLATRDYQGMMTKLEIVDKADKKCMTITVTVKKSSFPLFKIVDSTRHLPVISTELRGNILRLYGVYTPNINAAVLTADRLTVMDATVTETSEPVQEQTAAPAGELEKLSERLDALATEVHDMQTDLKSLLYPLDPDM